LKAAFPVIKEEFANIINNSLREGRCPEGSWKTSTIIPISKIDKAKKASEYGPINVLSIFEKVLELVKEQLEMYLETNGIITEHQSEFRKHYSCETAISKLSSTNGS